jgi:hypothetical protein
VTFAGGAATQTPPDATASHGLVVTEEPREPMEEAARSADTHEFGG